MNRPPPRSTRTDTLVPYGRFSDLDDRVRLPGRRHVADRHSSMHWFTGGEHSCARSMSDDMRYSAAAERSSTNTTTVSQTSRAARRAERSEGHTSELQSLMRHSYAVFC